MSISELDGCAKLRIMGLRGSPLITHITIGDKAVIALSHDYQGTLGPPEGAGIPECIGELEILISELVRP
ncbi:MAG: hypothetical protein AABW89_03765 [Nanoarchaeota archaeon]